MGFNLLLMHTGFEGQTATVCLERNSPLTATLQGRSVRDSDLLLLSMYVRNKAMIYTDHNIKYLCLIHHKQNRDLSRL